MAHVNWNQLFQKIKMKTPKVCIVKIYIFNRFLIDKLGRIAEDGSSQEVYSESTTTTTITTTTMTTITNKYKDRKRVSY